MEKGVGEGHGGLNKYALGCSLVASMISIIFGYDTGVMSGAMIYVKDEFHIGNGKTEILAGILNLCALVGSLCAGRTSDAIGRRYTIVLAAVIFLLGSVLMGYGPNYGVLIAGRCTAGIGVGFALMIGPVYSAEVSSPSTRGFLTGLPELGISIGILLGYLSNFIFSGLPLKIGWRVMLGIPAIPSLFLAIGVLKMPESPRWLILQGRLGEATKIMYKVSNGAEEAEARLSDMKLIAGIDEKCKDDVVKIEKDSQGKGAWHELLIKPTPTVRWMLMAAVGIHFFEHATGIEAVILYSHKIVEGAGIEDKRKKILFTVGVGLTKFIFVVTATFLVDRVGRRKLLLTSVGGMVISLFGLGTFLTIVHQHPGERIIWALVLSIITTYAFVMSFNIGLGPITWVYSAEIFPMKLRAQGASIGVAVNRLMNATVSMTFLTISDTITIGGAFYMFAGISVIAWLFFFVFCPETKGKSLEEMEILFTPKSSSINKNNSK
ncbi:PREDICTED: probable polyol transporter 6 [Ipomoea nil]|uniref:probable polyol transporter 6 n=1 Tax=Ipomoea nil TaxID=35883 RepID=UPI000901D204|nr:PREDICTED: probable polyol transporter 6 [Ipomoea nil]XP_019172950.1 PREDICTED: probable polyol transporter 6 [Ipomoea nil]XP_019172951.1 PREDICTED: probable polyol transporter 6 [Ipomoea nil]